MRSIDAYFWYSLRHFVHKACTSSGLVFREPCQSCRREKCSTYQIRVTSVLCEEIRVPSSILCMSSQLEWLTEILSQRYARLLWFILTHLNPCCLPPRIFSVEFLFTSVTVNCFSGFGNDHNEINPCICSTSHIIARLRSVISSRLIVSSVILSHSTVECAGSRPHRHNVTALLLLKKPTHALHAIID